MITTEDILNMNFYKKEKFTGSYKGMRYLVKKEKDDAENDVFRATVWPGPYNFDTTPDDQKISATFPFTEDGKQQAVDWMNEQWASRDEWGIIMHSQFSAFQFPASPSSCFPDISGVIFSLCTFKTSIYNNTSVP